LLKRLTMAIGTWRTSTSAVQFSPPPASRKPSPSKFSDTSSPWKIAEQEPGSSCTNRAECQLSHAASGCIKKTPESPLDCKKIKPANPKEINPEYSLEGQMLKMKLQYSGHLMWRANSLEKTLMLRKIEGRKGANGGWDGWMASPTQWTWVNGHGHMDTDKLWETVKDREAWRAAVHGVTKSQPWLSYWTKKINKG